MHKILKHYFPMRTKDRLKKNPDRLKLITGNTKGTYKDLKRQAVILGMSFPDATGAGIFELVRYIEKNSMDVTPDISLIDKYDEWISKRFDDAGLPPDDPLRNSRLRLGFLGDEDENGERKHRKIRGIVKKELKQKKEKDKHGHIKGTKKSYTWLCAEKGFTLERTTRRVIKKFPEAKAKSIQLWYRAALRSFNKK